MHQILKKKCLFVTTFACTRVRVSERVFTALLLFTATLLSLWVHLLTHMRCLCGQMKWKTTIRFLIFFLHGDGHMVKFSSSCSIKAPSSPDGWRAVCSVTNLLSMQQSSAFLVFVSCRHFHAGKVICMLLCGKEWGLWSLLAVTRPLVCNDGFVPDFFACESNSGINHNRPCGEIFFEATARMRVAGVF